MFLHNLHLLHRYLFYVHHIRIIKSSLKNNIQATNFPIQYTMNTFWVLLKHFILIGSVRTEVSRYLSFTFQYPSPAAVSTFRWLICCSYWSVAGVCGQKNPFQTSFYVIGIKFIFLRNEFSNQVSIFIYNFNFLACAVYSANNWFIRILSLSLVNAIPLISKPSCNLMLVSNLSLWRVNVLFLLIDAFYHHGNYIYLTIHLL